MQYFHPFLVKHVSSRLLEKEGQHVTMYFSWQEPYQAALVEVQPAELRRRIDAAEKAICQRVEQLKQAGTESGEELWAINDALRSLRVLAKAEGPPQHSAGGGRSQTGTAS
jgi:hypothetical protein